MLPHSIDDLEITKCHDKKKGSGGSGGLPRYNVTYKLISAKTQGKIRFTGTQRSGVSFLTGNNLPPTQRYPQACSSETGKRGRLPGDPDLGRGGCASPSQPVYFLARTKDENDRSVELKHLGTQLPNAAQ